MKNTQDKYLEFLEGKKRTRIKSGFDISNEELNEHLFDFQKFIVKRALKYGKFAIFADCGLGKTIMQLEWAHRVNIHTGKPVLILAPLAVSGQTIEEGNKFGIEVLKYGHGNGGIYITNYDQLQNVDTSAFSGIVLDESSILKNFEGKTKKLIIDSFHETPYKLACTATPSPNDPMELGNHSEFLDIMGRNEMLAMYFVHDGGDTAKWRLKGHAEKEFYKWIATWAVMLSKPGDIGFSNDGYNLPKLNIIEREIETSKRDNGMLFNDVAVNATNFNQELRITLLDRIELVADMVNKSDESFIVWTKQNEEAQKLSEMIDGSINVRGSDNPNIKEQNLLGFAHDKFRVLVTKSKIAQFGLNYQNCHNQVFCSLDFSFESLYQSIRRSYRFGQNKPVNIYLVTTDTMQNVVNSIKDKQRKFEIMQSEMSKHVSENTIREDSVLDHSEFYFISEDSFRIGRGDCVQLIQNLEDESIGFSVFSPPFADLYTYSDHLEDMGNAKDYNEFNEQFKFLVDQLFRVIKPGRNVAVHCMDLPIQKGKEGFIGLRDFSGMILRMFEESGFIYHSRITIWKDPVVEMQRTKALGLLHKQIKKDATMSRVGIPDYVLVFRKDGERNDPVNCNIPVDVWQRYASPVWMDINYSDTLQFRSAREDKDEKHICPLQLPTIERLIHLYTNPGDTVLSPFAGIGSEGYQALKMDRKFVGFELKQSYFDQMEKNLRSAVIEKNQIELF